MDREYFHESVVRDVVDILTTMKDYDEVQFELNNLNRRSFKSVASATKDLILTFPMLASADLDPESVSMAAKAHEKKCAAMLHILFSAICVGSNEDVYDYVRKFHTNINTLDATLDDYMDAFDKLALKLDEGAMTIDKKAVEAVLEDLRNSNYVLPDDIEESAISDYKIVPGYKTGMGDIIINEANKTNPNGKNKNKPYNITNTYTGDIVNNVSSYTAAKGDSEDKKEADRAKRVESMTNVEKNRVLNAEYKKANELMPTMMVVNFISKDDNDKISTLTCTIGVKVKVYPVSTTDIANRITSKIQDKDVLNSFIRATTNEIAFFRDFIFAIDKAKLDALSYGKDATSNKLWKVLERRAVKSKFRRTFRMYNDATAITALCLSDNLVKEIKESSNIDLMNVGTARRLLDAYNFIAIIVLNEAIEVANFLYDSGDDNYERLTFSNMEREASDNTYKKMVNLLTKVSR